MMAPPVTPLVLTRDRDAHAVIRGFVYQIDVTLERWLDLASDEVLLLEAGEDIDLVAGLFAGPDDAPVRTLEAVKNLSGNITLRTSSAIEAIAAYIEHRANNPSAHLIFRFTTTAQATRERPSPFQAPAIAVWEQVREGSVERAAALDGIRELLAGVVRPSGLAEATWTRFTEFWRNSTDEALLDLILGFSWSLAEPGAELRETQVREKLRGRLGDDEAYPFFFLHVCRVLATDGEKRLVRTDLERLAQGWVRDDYLRVTKTVRPFLEVVRGLAAPVARVESKVDALREEVRATQAGLFDRGGLVLEMSGRLSIQRGPGALPPNLASRSALVRRLAGGLAKVRWLALDGGAATGKSTLVDLIGHSDETLFPSVRLRLRDASSAECTAMVRRVHDQLGTSRDGEIGSIILDDIPRIVTGDLLHDALRDLLALKDLPRVLSTSAHRLPRSLREVLGEALLQEAPTWFVAEEVEEILRSLGAPPPFVAQAAPLLVQHTQGHPSLCAAVADALLHASWREDALRDLTLDGTPELAEEVFERLLRSIEGDEACRELLSRAALAKGDLALAQLPLLAEVAPELRVRDDCVHRAMGTWLRREGSDRVSVSPLLKVRLAERLPPTVIQAVRVALGDALLSERLVTPLEVARAISYFVEAADWPRVSYTLLRALSSVRSGEKGPWVSHFYELAGRLVGRLEPNVATVVSAERLAFLDDMAVTAEDRRRVHNALSEPTTPGWVLVYIGGVVGLARSEENFETLIRVSEGVARVVLGGTPIHDDPSFEAPALETSKLLAFATWRAGTRVRTAGELRRWSAFMFGLPGEALELALSDEHAPVLATTVANSVWLHGHRERDAGSAPDWQAIVAALDELAALSADSMSELLAGAAGRARTITVGDYMGARDEAIAWALEFAETLVEPWSRFLVLESAAAQHLYAGNLELARALYEDVVALADGVLHVEVVDSLLRAAWAAVDAEAVRFTTAALDVARRLPGAGPLLVARGEYEHAVALHRAGRAREALESNFAAHQRALRALGTEGSDNLRAMIALGGHTLVFLDHLVRYGRPLVVDGKAFEPPKQGMFLQASVALASRTDDAAVARARGIMTRVAALLGDRVGAVAWGESVWEDLQAGGATELELVLPMVADPLAATALLERRYSKALTILHRAVSAADLDAKLSAEIAVLQPGLMGALLAMLWDEADGRSARESFVAEVAATRAQLQASPASAPLWDSLDTILGLVRSRPGWDACYKAPTTNDLAPARYLLASAEEDAAPDVSASLQAIAFASLGNAFRAFPSIGEWIAVPALAAYWRRRLEQQAFLFAAPTHVARVLGPGVERQTVRSLLREVVHATAPRRLPLPAQAWLKDEHEES